MRKFALLFFFVAVLSFTTKAHAACEEILQDGTLKAVQFESSDEYQLAIYKAFANSTYSQSKNSRVLGAGIPFGEAVMGTLDYSEGDFEEKRAQVRDVLSTNFSSASSLNFAMSSGDPVIVDAWSRCMSERGGFIKIEIERRSADIVGLQISWNAGNSTVTSATLRDDIYVGDKTVLQGAYCLEKGTELMTGAPCPVLVKLDNSSDSLLVSVNSDAGSETAFVPPRMRLTREVRPYNYLAGGCATPPPANYRKIAEWGQRCPLRIAGFAKRQTLDYSASLTLGEELVNDGWVFDSSSAQLNLSQHRGRGDDGNRCTGARISASSFVVSYGYKAEGKGDRNVTTVCSALATVNIERLKLTPY